MPPLLTDENVDRHLIAGLRAREPAVDVVRVQEVGLMHTPDPMVLAWAAEHGRVIVTHDRNSLPGFAYDRVNAGLPMPGVLLVSDEISIGQAIEEVLTAIVCLDPDEFPDQVHYLPAGG